jgi:hypothetical protein
VKILHLTVTRSGLISLWDSRDKAERGKQPCEFYVALQLTAAQERTLEIARQHAQPPAGGDR